MMRIIEETEYWGSEGTYECNPILLTEEEIARHEGDSEA